MKTLFLALCICAATVSNLFVQNEATIVVAGDNLIHSTIIKSGRSEDGYDYNDMYEPIAGYIQSFDMAVINQETPLINDESKFSGYPMFGGPVEVGEAVINAGFDVVTQATNHAIDKGMEGIEDSFNFWTKNQIPVIGIRKDPIDRFVVKEVNGIKIGMCNFTYGLNGLQKPEGKDWIVDDLNDDDVVRETIMNVKAVSDVVIVFTHWGTEYVYEPTAYQTERAQFIADCGADVIVGTHPHVVEPVVEITSADGRAVPVFYSLGNFISSQDEVPRMLGALAEITVTKDGVVSYKATPVVTHIETYSKYFKTYLLSDYTEELAAEHRLRRVKGQAFSVEALRDLWNKVMVGYEM